MSVFAPITDAQLAQARRDPVFRQKMLEQSLELLLASVQRLRNAQPAPGTIGAQQMREAIELAVRLAEMIQRPKTLSRSRA